MTTRPIVRPGTALVMNSFSPVTSKTSPAGMAVVRRAVRSEPALGSEARLYQQAPVAGAGQLAHRLGGHLRVLVVERVRLPALADDFQRTFHGGVARGGRGQGRRGEQVQRRPPVPHGAVDGAVDS